MYLIILHTQSASGAALEIILMLLVAAIIAAVTTYFYTKSRFQSAITNLEETLDKSKKEKKQLEAELREANQKIDELQKENEELAVAYKQSKSKASKATKEVEKTNKKLKQTREELEETEEELKEKEDLLKRISERKHLLDYTSFGTATIEEKDDLKMISGIGPFIEEKLNMLDIYTFKQISKFTKKDMLAVNKAIEYFEGRIERDEWISQAKELVYTGGKGSEVLENIRKRKHRINYDRIGIAHKEDAQDLTAIDGIGGWIQEKLYALDIFTYEQISKFSPEEVKSVTEIIEFFPGRIERDMWVSQAKELVG